MKSVIKDKVNPFRKMASQIAAIAKCPASEASGTGAPKAHLSTELYTVTKLHIPSIYAHLCVDG